MQPPNQPPQYPYGQPPQPPKKKRRWWIWALVIIGFIVLVGSCNAIITGGNGVGNTDATPTPSSVSQRVVHTATNMPGAKPTLKPTSAPVSHWPPKTKADLQALAAQGDAGAIHEFHSESVGAVGVCPEPKRLSTVDPSITGKQLAEDLLAYFYANHLDNPCGSAAFAYHTQAEANDVYTAGRILFDAVNPDGSANFDPNATNLKYTLTLDVGGDLAGQQEYIVTY